MHNVNRVNLANYLSAKAQGGKNNISMELVGLIEDVACACRAISKTLSYGDLGEAMGKASSMNVQGEVQANLDILSDDLFKEYTEHSGHVVALISEEMEALYRVPNQHPTGSLLLYYDPLDGSSNIDINVSVGSIFSVFRAPAVINQIGEEDCYLPGRQQLAAGYALYGPSTQLVLSVGDGVVGFTLDPDSNEFFLTRENIKVPPHTSEFAINASNGRFWEPAVKRYVSECVAGNTGPRERDFNMRWIASLVAETHRILNRGGVFLYPKDNKFPELPGRLRLMYEASPVAFLMEQAGAKATTGTVDILDVRPNMLHQRVPLIFGSSEEIERIQHYHQIPFGQDDSDFSDPLLTTPLFNHRGLFQN